MKFLVLLLAFTAVATASVINVNKYGLTNKLGVNSIYGQGYRGFYGQSPALNQFWNKNFWQQKYGRDTFDTQEVYGNQAIFNREATYGPQQFYGQDVSKILSHVLFRIFNRQVWVDIFSQYVYQQNWNQYVWDNILEDQDIFDKEVLIQLIRQPVLRNVLIQEGIFDKTVLEQILYTFNVQQTYNHVLLEQLVNKVALKNWLYNLGFYDKSVLYQFFNRRIYENTFSSMEVGQEWFMQVVNNPVLRKFLVEQGVFNVVILQQISHFMNDQGVYSEHLLKQLINKAVLRSFFIQHGFVDYSVLNQLLSNEIFGLKVYLRVQFFQHIPGFSYKQLMTEKTYSPEYVFEQIENFPVGERFFGLDYTDSSFGPIAQSIAGVLFGNQRYQHFQTYTNMWTNKSDKLNFLWNIIFGHQGLELSGEFPNGYFNNFYGRQGFYRHIPVFQY